MTRKRKHPWVFYITLLTQKGNMMTLQTPIRNIMNSHNGKELDEYVELQYIAGPGSLNILVQEPYTGHKPAHVVKGYIIDSGGINVQNYMEEVRREYEASKASGVSDASGVSETTDDASGVSDTRPDPVEDEKQAQIDAAWASIGR